MSQDFGIDNAGSGFDFEDDDEDLEAMFNRANEGEETEDDDSYLNYTSSYAEQPVSENVENVSDNNDQVEITSSENAWEELPNENSENLETVGSSVPTYDDTTVVVENTDYENFEEYKTPQEESVEQFETIPEPISQVVQEKPVQEEYGQSFSSNYNSMPSSSSANIAPEQTTVQKAVEPVVNQQPPTRKFNITTEQEDIESVRKTIKILDAYRKLSSKSIVAQLIYNENDVDPDDEAALVVRVLRADPMLGKMMTVLRESASEKDRVERVFYILNTDQDVLKYLGSFLETVSDVEFDNTHNHIAFAKEVEKTIETLDNKIVQHVADAQSVLVAAEDEKE